MAVTNVSGRRWTRKHDNPGVPTVPSAPMTWFPTSLEDVIELCAAGNPGMTAAGSHWALSTTAIADTNFVETHDPDITSPAMAKTLTEVVPGCLSRELLTRMAAAPPSSYSTTSHVPNDGTYFVHVQTGKRVFQLYAELDQGDDNNLDSLAVLLTKPPFDTNNFLGPWAFQTLGGAGGQTVFGALTTGTHGGDFTDGPIAESVVAMHLVTDGGRHYWIERESLPYFQTQFTDDAALHKLYGDDKFKGNQARGIDNFEIIRDDDVFNAVLIGAWRFGIVYSVVLRAVRQYSLEQLRVLKDWTDVRDEIMDPGSELFADPPAVGADQFQARFLQIAICVTPYANSTKNRVGVSKHWNVAAMPDAVNPFGRAERVGMVVAPFDSQLGGPRFEFAGNSHGYTPGTVTPPATAQPASFLSLACMNADFMVGVLQAVAVEVTQFVNSNGAVIGAGLAAVMVVGGPVVATTLLAALAILLAVLAPLILAIVALVASGGNHLGNVLNDVGNALLNRSDPTEREAGMLIWQMIGYELFSQQQSNSDCTSISYAMMDGNDYLDASCNVNIDSIEVFFDAADPMLPAFVDALLAFEVLQERTFGRAFIGYISLRFTGPTKALLGEERFERTCVAEVAGFLDASGTKPLIDFALMLALDPNFSGILHWGQRNPATQADIQRLFGDTVTDPSGPLHRWRAALSRLTANGRLDAFSNGFTRQTGLEIVTPQIASLGVPPGAVVLGVPCDITWDCVDNPNATQVTLSVTDPGGGVQVLPTPTLGGTAVLVPALAGVHAVNLVASLTVGGETREVAQQQLVSVQ
jgi:hypothetical protein